MKIHPLSESKIEKACNELKARKGRAERDPKLGCPNAPSLVKAYKVILTGLENEVIRMDNNAGDSLIVDLEFVAGGEQCSIWPVMVIGGGNFEGLMIKAWFDNAGTGHILTNYGTYHNEIKYATASDMHNWILEYLRLQD